jgi:hypothetical protein
MANSEQVELLLQGVEAWNSWRAKEPSIRIDLSRANLTGRHLSGANLSGANLSGAYFWTADLAQAHLIQANLSGAKLPQANLAQANLSGANLSGAYLPRADLRRAELFGADLSRANLTQACLSPAYLFEADLTEADLTRAILIEADLTRAILTGAQLVDTNLADATLTDCRIYGISAWNVKLNEGTKQQGLIITPHFEPEVTVDDLEVAQFVYLLLHNEKIRRVIDTITSKVVLILGRFSIPERKRVLDALREELRKSERGYVPVVFDFEKPTSRTTDEAITLLASMARFVIADISGAKSVLQELRGIVPDNPTLPVQPIIIADEEEPGMFDFFKRYPWFLKVYRYRNPAQLLADLDKRVIAPPEAKAAKVGASTKLASTRQTPSERPPRHRG